MRIGMQVDSAAFEAALRGQLGEALAQEGQKIMLRKVYQARNYAVRWTPIDTGRLISGWFVTQGEDAKGWYAGIGNMIEYATEVEFGARGRPGRRMLRRALTTVFKVQGMTPVFTAGNNTAEGA